VIDHEGAGAAEANRSRRKTFHHRGPGFAVFLFLQISAARAQHLGGDLSEFCLVLARDSDPHLFPPPRDAGEDKEGGTLWCENILTA
jgi:hypothetical protein